MHRLHAVELPDRPIHVGRGDARVDDQVGDAGALHVLVVGPVGPPRGVEEAERGRQADREDHTEADEAPAVGATDRRGRQTLGGEGRAHASSVSWRDCRPTGCGPPARGGATTLHTHFGEFPPIPDAGRHLGPRKSSDEEGRDASGRGGGRRVVGLEVDDQDVVGVDPPGVRPQLGSTGPGIAVGGPLEVAAHLALVLTPTVVVPAFLEQVSLGRPVQEAAPVGTGRDGVERDPPGAPGRRRSG